MTQSTSQPFRFDQWFDDSLQNAGVVTGSPWFDFTSGLALDPGADTGSAAPMAFHSSTSFAMVAPGQWGNPAGANPPGSAGGGGLNVNTGNVNASPAVLTMTSEAGVTPGSVPIVTSQSIFSGGSATAASASDLNALITAADSQTSAGTLTIDISGSISLNTLPAVPDGESLTFAAGSTTGAITALTGTPDIAAINLHSGVSLVINGSSNAVLDGGNTVRGLFAYAGNLTVNNLTIQNTKALGGAGGTAGFAGGGGAGLGGGLFVATGANVTLNSVSFSNNQALGGAGGNNTGGDARSKGMAGGGGLGGNGGLGYGIYFSGGGGVGRTAFGGDGSEVAVHNDGRDTPGAGAIVGGASGGKGADFAYTLGGSPPNGSVRTAGAANGGGGGIAQAISAEAPPYIGGGGGGGGVGGHAGYSYAANYDSKHTHGGGGVGGFGGGGGGGYYYGANGGFGGGAGGGEYKYGGNGGFGGGGGGEPNATLGKGGFGAGNAGGGKNVGNYGTSASSGSPLSNYAYSGGDSGGGGLGAGGAVFVESGGVLTLGGAGTVNTGTVAGGSAGIATMFGTAVTSKSQTIDAVPENGFNTNGTAGSAFGSGIFIQNNSTTAAQGVTLAPGSGQTLTVSGVIADEQGSGGTGANNTAGKLVIAGGGDVKLTGSNTFEGGSSISANSTLDLGGTHAAGTGAITFGAGGGRLLIETAAQPNGSLFSNSVSAFGTGDVIDLSGLTFHTGATAHVVSNTLTVISNNVTDTVSVPGGAASNLITLQDAGTGTMVEIHSPPTVTASGTATFNGGGAAVLIDSGAVVTDPSSTTLVSATIAITTGLLSSDTLTVGTLGGLSEGFSSGALTLSGTASLATYQTALDSIKFGTTPTNTDPTNGGSDTSRTIDWSVNDGTLNSGTVASTVDTVHVAPVVTAGATANYAGDGLDPPVVADPGLTVTDPDSGGTLVGAAITISSGFTAGDALNFSAQNGIAESGFNSGTLTLTGTATVQQYQTALASITYSSSLTDPTVGHTDNTRTVSWTAADSVDTSNAATSLIDVTPCYCRGTRLLTDRGEVAVEDLRIGDRMVTLFGGTRPVRWIGFRHLDLSRHPAPGQALPIRIRADAFADAVPSRDLLVSPDHAVLFDNQLVLARLLVNGASIVREAQCQHVTYYHVELETHDILVAEGLLAESYLDTGNRGTFENANEPLILHPDFGDVPDFDEAQRERVARSCQPFASDAASVEPIWRYLAVRATMLGFSLPAEGETTTDPALRVIANGQVIRPVSVEGGRHVFVLPPLGGAGTVRLVSRSASPCDVVPWVEDRRRLGVRVSGVTLTRGGEAVPIPLDHPRLSHGWWDVERDSATLWRWTDGDAVIPVPRADLTALEIMVTGTLDYEFGEPRDASERAAAA